MHQQSAFWCLEDARDLITDQETWRRLQNTDHFTRMAITSGSCGRVAERRTSQEAYDYFSAYLRALARCEAACQTQIRPRLAAQALRCLPPDKAFHFHSEFRFTGYSAHSLKEFSRLLELVPDEVFRFHQERGDFSRWITEVLGDTTLARSIAQCKKPGEAAHLVTERCEEVMPRLKIAQFCWESLHAIREGGLSPAATHLADVLGTTHEVHFFTRGDGTDRRIGGVYYHFCHPEGDTILDYCQDLSMKLLKKFNESDTPPFDIIHFHDWHCIDALEELRDRATVMSYHSTEYGRNGGNFGDWPEFRAISAKEWRGGHLAGHVITVSKHTKTEVMWLYGIPERNITVIPNGIYPEQVPLSARSRLGKKTLWHSSARPPGVLHRAAGVPERTRPPGGCHTPVLNRRWDVQFIIAGKGDMRRELEERCRTLPSGSPAISQTRNTFSS